MYFFFNRINDQHVNDGAELSHGEIWKENISRSLIVGTEADLLFGGLKSSTLGHIKNIVPNGVVTMNAVAG